MSTVTLETGSLRLEILPEAGASVVTFARRFGGVWLPLLRETPPEAIAALNPSLMASFTLLPWSNRIPEATFRFQGHHYPLRANTPEGYAIHGDVRRRPWKVIAKRPAAVTCEIDSRDFSDFNFPFPLTAQIHYELSETDFDTTLMLTNSGNTPMPAGFGFHPYFNRAFGAHGVDEAQLQLHVAGVYPPLPGGPMALVTREQDFSRLASIDKRDINHCFGGWTGQATIVYPGAGVQLRLDCAPVLGHVVVFTPPDKPYFAVEPVSHVTNGFNLFAQGQAGTGIQVLEPRESMAGRFRLKVLQ
ncbi:MAG: aldose 1-epimerase [Dehalococcoidia bacterium]|nr:aldose 1-epimerase [Dehalococcoidia bacterium]